MHIRTATVISSSTCFIAFYSISLFFSFATKPTHAKQTSFLLRYRHTHFGFYPLTFYSFPIPPIHCMYIHGTQFHFYGKQFSFVAFQSSIVYITIKTICLIARDYNCYMFTLGNALENTTRGEWVNTTAFVWNALRDIGVGGIGLGIWKMANARI